jgi:imidazolonepropionase-like amidohydrolase
LSILLTNCNIVNIEQGSIIENSNVLISEGVIRQIGNNDSTYNSCLDMQGCYILPGLINAHNNISNVFPFKNTNINEPPAETVLRCFRRAHDALLGGVTTLRTMGEIHRADLSLKKMINEKWIPGPRIMAAGKGIGITGGHGAHLGQTEADGADACLKAARYELSLGVDHLKIFITGGIAGKSEKLEEPQMTEEEMRAVVLAARSKGTYVAAHAGSSYSIQSAIEAGVRSIEHGYVLDTETVKMMRENACYYVPTLSVTRSPNWMREHGFEEWVIEKAVSAGERHMESVKLAVREGVKIVVGTDLPPGDTSDGVLTTVREIEFLHEAGLSALEAVKSATIVAAELCRIDNIVGLLKPNYVADIIAVRENPLNNLRTLEKIQFVMQEGQVVRNDLAA